MSGMFRAPPGYVFIWLIRVVPGDILRGSIRAGDAGRRRAVYSIQAGRLTAILDRYAAR